MPLDATIETLFTLLPINKPAPLVYGLIYPDAKVRLLLPPVIVPNLIKPSLVVALVLNVTSEPKVNALSVNAVLVVWIVPLSVTVLGATAVKPPAYVCVPPLCPSVSVPTLLNVTALVIVPPLPVNTT